MNAERDKFNQKIRNAKTRLRNNQVPEKQQKLAQELEDLIIDKQRLVEEPLIREFLKPLKPLKLLITGAEHPESRRERQLARNEPFNAEGSVTMCRRRS